MGSFSVSGQNPQGRITHVDATMTESEIRTERRIAAVRLVALASLPPLLWWDVIPPPSQVALAWLTVLISAYILVAAFALPRLRYTPRKDLFLVIDILAITALVYSTGRIQSPVLFLFYLPIIAAAVRTDLRHTVLSAVAISAIVVWMWSISEGGVLSLGRSGVKVGLFTSGCFALALLFGLLAQESRLSEARAVLNRALDQKLSDATAQLRQRLAELEALYGLSRRLAGATEVPHVLEAMAESARAQLAAPHGAVFMHDHVGGGLSLAHAQGLPSGDARAVMYACEYRLSERVTAPLMIETAEATLWTRALCAPIRVTDRLIGAVCAGGGPDWRYADSALRVLSNVADQGGIALQRVYLLEDLQRLALADPAVRLFSQEQLSRILVEEVKRSRQLGAPCALLKVQLVGLAELSSRLGEAATDLLVKRAASIILDSARRVDMQVGQVARGPGGTFSIVLPMTTADAARKFASKLRERLEQDPTAARLLSAPRGLDSLIGIAVFPDDAGTMDELHAFTQRALDAATSSRPVMWAAEVPH